jgi:hypothetical protein
MNDNDGGVSEARNRLREKAQNEETCVAFNDLLKAEKLENKKLREENERLRKDAEWMNGDIADLRQLIARYRERELTMGWNQE